MSQINLKLRGIMYTDEQWIRWFDKLAEDDFVVVDNFLFGEQFSLIMNFFKQAEENNHLKKTGIGTSREFQIKSSVRGDFIYWLDESRDTEKTSFFDIVGDLITNLKRFCYLNLSGSEFHIAKYPAGSHYDRHLDQFNERSNRHITVLIYLNEKWKRGDGGELVIYKEEKEIVVQPIAKRLLLFKSDVIEHEVLTTNVSRYSLTGWLLHQPASVSYLI